METLCIKQEPVEEDVKSNKVICIKIEPGNSSEPKLFISNCESCENPIEPRLTVIKKELVHPCKSEIKKEPDDVLSNETISRNCPSPTVSSDTDYNSSPASKSLENCDIIAPIPSVIQHKNSPNALPLNNCNTPTISSSIALNTSATAILENCNNLTTVASGVELFNNSPDAASLVKCNNIPAVSSDIKLNNSSDATSLEKSMKSSDATSLEKSMNLSAVTPNFKLNHLPVINSQRLENDSFKNIKQSNSPTLESQNEVYSHRPEKIRFRSPSQQDRASPYRQKKLRYGSNERLSPYQRDEASPYRSENFRFRSPQLHGVSPYRPENFKIRPKESSSPFPPQLYFQHSDEYKPKHQHFRYRHHNRSNYSRASHYYRGKPRPWEYRCPLHQKKNKENNYVLKNEVKPEKELRIVKMISNNELQIKDSANTLKEQNPISDHPSTSSTIETSSNDDDSFPCILNQNSDSLISINEVNNNIEIEPLNKENTSACNTNEIIECEPEKINKNFIDEGVQNLFDLEEKTETVAENDNLGNQIRKSIDKCETSSKHVSFNELETSSKLGDGDFNFPSDLSLNEDEMCSDGNFSSFDSNFILNEDGKDSEPFFIIDEVNDMDYDMEEVKQDLMEENEKDTTKVSIVEKDKGIAKALMNAEEKVIEEELMDFQDTGTDIVKTNNVDDTKLVNVLNEVNIEINDMIINNRVEENSGVHNTYFENMVVADTTEDDAFMCIAVEENALKDDALKDDALKDDALKDDALKDDALEDDTLKDDALKDDALKDDALKDDALKDDALKDDALKDDALKDDVLKDDTLKDNAGMENVLMDNVLMDNEDMDNDIDNMVKDNTIVGNTMNRIVVVSDSDAVKALKKINDNVENLQVRRESDTSMNDSMSSNMYSDDLEVTREVILDIDDAEIVKIIKISQAEVEVVKEVCDEEIECVFSKLKEAHICRKCFVERRRRKKNLDSDVIFIKTKTMKSKSDIPIISIDETDDCEIA